MNLAIVVPRFNPCNYRKPRQNFQRFIAALQQQVDISDVFVVEALFPGQASDHGWWTRAPLPATDQNFLWQKESLINFAIRRLPPQYDAVAWIDADLQFRDKWWYEDACKKLKEFQVVQLFEQIRYYDNLDCPSKLGYSTVTAGDRRTFRAPGGAIACRREILADGIYDRDPLGDGDSIFMDCVMRRGMTKWSAHARRWAEQFAQQPHSVGFIRSGVNHLYHGTIQNRRYKSRQAILAEHSFDAETDVRINECGLLEWSSDKPALHQAVREFFINRNEDE